MADETLETGAGTGEAPESPGASQGTNAVTSGAAETHAASQPSTSTGGTPAPAGEYESVRDVAKALGHDASSFSDDRAYVAHLIQRANAAEQYQGQVQQLQQLAQYGNVYLQHATEFQRWQQERQQQAQPKPAKAWDPPQFDPAWQRLITKDPQTGEPRLVPGAPPDILPKYFAYEQYRRDFAEKLFTDPQATLKPFIEEQARAIAQEMVGGQLGSYQEAQQAQAILAQNASWMFAANPLNGRQTLTPEGRKYAGYIYEAQHNYRISDSKLQHQFALRSMAAELANLQAGQTPQQVGETQKQAALQTGNRRPSMAGSTVQKATAQNSKLSLKQQLAADLAAAGVTDADFAAARL